MTSVELLARLQWQTALLLIVSGFVAMTLRRHLVANLLGVQVAILGSGMLVCRQGAVQNAWMAVVLIVAAAVFAPLGFVAFAWWRVVRGRASQSALQETDGPADG